MANTIDLMEYAAHISLDDKGFTDGIKNAEDSSEGFKGKMSGMAGFLKTSVVAGIAAVGIALGGMAIAGVKSAMELDDTFAKFKASTGMVGEEADKVKETVKDLFKTNEVSYEDLAKMAEGLHNNMQMSADDIKKYGQNYLDFAKVTGQSIDEAIGAIDDLGDAWGLNNDEVLPIMDRLKLSQEKYGLSVQDGQSALKGLAASFQGLGMNTDEAIGYLNLFASTGVESGVATTAFNYALKQVESPEALKEAIKDLQSTENATERAKKAVDLFGAKAGVQMANALKPGTQSIEDIMKSMNGATGSIDRASKAYDSSLKVQLSLLSKQLQGLFTDLGDKLTPLVRDFVSWLQTNMPAVKETLTAVFFAIGNVIGSLVTIISEVSSAFTSWYNSNSQSSQAFKSQFDAFKVWFMDIFNTLVEIVKTALSIIQTFWQQHGDQIMSIVKPIWEAIKIIISYTLETIKNVLKLALAVIQGDWTGAWEIVKQMFINAWETMKALLPNLLEALKNVLKAEFQNFYNIGKTLFSMLWQGLQDVWTGITSWVSEKISWLQQQLSSILSIISSIGSAGSSTGAPSSNLRQSSFIKSYDVGTPYVPYDQLAFIHKGEQIIPAAYNPNNSVSKSASQGINNHYNIHIDKVETQDAESFTSYLPTLAMQHSSSY